MATPGSMAARQESAQAAIVAALEELAPHYQITGIDRLRRIANRGDRHYKAIMQLEAAADLINQMAAAVRVAPDAAPLVLPIENMPDPEPGLNSFHPAPDQAEQDEQPEPDDQPVEGPPADTGATPAARRPGRGRGGKR